MNILGISAFYHDSAAALIMNGEIVAAAEEERFSRKKHDAAFPAQAVDFCLQYVDHDLSRIDYVVFYDKPLLKFDRLLETALATAPWGFRLFFRSMPVWLKEKLYLKRLLKSSLKQLSKAPQTEPPPLLFTEHHQAHAGAAYYASPFNEAAVLCLDGVGEWQTSSLWHATGNALNPLYAINFPHSLGLLYSAFTAYLGFKVNSGEYKVMGLAPYGSPVYVDAIRSNLIDIKPDGSFHLNMRYFAFTHGLRMIMPTFEKLFGKKTRQPESDLAQFHFDIAASIQKVTEEIVLKLAQTLRTISGSDNLVLAGGVALNCVANGILRRSGLFNRIWAQPAAGDAGAAIGAALYVWHEYLGKPRLVVEPDSMQYAYLGPHWKNDAIHTQLVQNALTFSYYDDDSLFETIARLLDEKQVVGWFQGRIEFGPRALGNRSILADPRPIDMQETLNHKIKNRESFRPFAPVILEEELANWFETRDTNPYMLFVEQVRKDSQTIPAVTHIDGSARVQTVNQHQNARLHALLSRFFQRTGCPILVNTSFNVRGEPIVQSPLDAIRCFASTEMDVLVMGNYLLYKSEQSRDAMQSLSQEIIADD